MTSSSEILSVLPVLVFIAALIAAAISDAASYTIPNRCPLLIVLAFAAHSVGAPPMAAFAALLTASAVFAVGLFVFGRGWLGGGDVKLITAVALWTGPAWLPLFLVSSSLAGGTVALLYLSPLRHRLPQPVGASVDSTEMPAARQPVPFGIAIAVGGTVVASRFLA
jgi:prepilin peptidase CpaA